MRSAGERREYPRARWVDVGMNKPLIIAVLVTIATLVAVGAIAFKDAREWQTFVDEHECTVVSKIAGSTHTGTHTSHDGSLGTHTTYSPGQTCWVCDDGVEYCR